MINPSLPRKAMLYGEYRSEASASNPPPPNQTEDFHQFSSGNAYASSIAVEVNGGES